MTEAFRINSAGDITGRYRKADGKWHAFLLSEGVFTSIDLPGAIQTASFPPPVGINDAGDMVGSYCAGGPCPLGLTGNLTTTHGFLLRRDRDAGEGLLTIDFPGAVATGAYAINTRGDVVGPYVDANHKVHGFLRSR